MEQNFLKEYRFESSCADDKNAAHWNPTQQYYEHTLASTAIFRAENIHMQDKKIATHSEVNWELYTF